MSPVHGLDRRRRSASANLRHPLQVAQTHLRPCPSAALPGFRGAELTGLSLSVCVPCAVLHPPPKDDVAGQRSPGAGGQRPLASRSHPRHSSETRRTTFVSLRQPVIARSSTVTRPRCRASRRAVRTSVSDTPASAAMWPTARRQSPRRQTSAATTARTAISPGVNRAASWGGSRPEAAQRRRRSRLASERGREPTGFLGVSAAAGRTLRLSIRADSSSASASFTCPAP